MIHICIIDSFDSVYSINSIDPKYSNYLFFFSHVAEGGRLNPGSVQSVPHSCVCAQLEGENISLRTHLSIVKKEWESSKAEIKVHVSAIADLRMQLGLKDLELSHAKQERTGAKKALEEVEAENERLRKEVYAVGIKVAGMNEVVAKIREAKHKAVRELENLRFSFSQAEFMKR